MNTNAGARDEIWWAQLAKTFDLWGAVISVMVLHTNHLYRQGVSWKAVERPTDALRTCGRARWDFPF